jgi:hypothetical protein
MAKKISKKTTVKAAEKPAKRMARAAKKPAKRSSKKLESLSQTHGKEEYKPTTLDQIWGDTGMSKYGTLDEGEYEGKLREMNRSDIHSHASKVGVIPVDNREMLNQRLLREFKKHLAAYRAPVDKETRKIEISDNVKKILAEGR